MKRKKNRTELFHELLIKNARKDLLKLWDGEEPNKDVKSDKEEDNGISNNIACDMYEISNNIIRNV